MRTAADALELGGSLLLFEGHPVATMLDERASAHDPLTVRWSYESSEPFVEEIQGTYADPNAVLKSPRTVNFAHGLSRIMTAALNAGFEIRKFEEFDRVPWKALPQTVQLDEFYWAIPTGIPFVPLSFALRAELMG